MDNVRQKGGKGKAKDVIVQYKVRAKGGQGKAESGNVEKERLKGGKGKGKMWTR